MDEERHPLRLLALGGSLTAGYYRGGLAYHPYAKQLFELFASIHIPVVIDEQGVSGERVRFSMVQRLEIILAKNTSSYNWVLILGGSNDLATPISTEEIFHQCLKVMYEMVLHQTAIDTKLLVMTIMQISRFPPGHKIDKKREALNAMIRDYVTNHDTPERVCLVDLDKAIQYHSMSDITERNLIWDDGVHLTPAGYDQMATVIFEVMKKKLAS